MKHIALLAVLLHWFSGNAQYTFNLYSGWDPNIPLGLIYDVELSPSGDVWSVNLDKLVQFDGTNWVEYNSTNCSIPMSSANRMVALGTDLWVSTPASGLYKLDISGVVTSFTVANSGLLNDSIVDLTANSLGHLILKTNNGLMSFDGVSNWTDIDISPLDECFKIAVDGNDDIWCSQPEGPAQYDGSSWTLHDTVGYCPNSSNYLMSAGAQGVCFSDGQNITIYDGTNWSLLQNGVPGFWKTSILYDDAGNIWLNVTDGGFPETAHLYLYDGNSWILPTASGNPYEPEYWAGNLTIAPDGSIWSSLARDLVELNHSTGVLEHADQEIVVYPQPCDGRLFIQEGVDAVTSAKVFDMSTQLCLTKTNQNGIKTIDASMLPNGFYILELSTKSGQSISKKIVIQ